MHDDIHLESVVAKALAAWHNRHRRGYNMTTLTMTDLANILRIPEARAEVWHPHLVASLDEFKINTPARLAAFLGQIGLESGGFRYVKEIWKNTRAQQSYEGAARLGNTEPGDGERFMGRGPPQLTGRKNYRLASEALGVDFIAQPQLVERMDYGCRVAGWFWTQGAGQNLNPRALGALKRYGFGVGVNLNDLADKDDDLSFGVITLCINGGLTHLDQRAEIRNRARIILDNKSDFPISETIEKDAQ